MAKNKKPADAAKDKAAKQKKIAIGLVCVLALAVAYAVNTMMGMSGGGAASKPQAVDPATAASTTPVATVASPVPVAPSLAGSAVAADPAAAAAGSTSAGSTQLLAAVSPPADAGQLQSFSQFTSRDPLRRRQRIGVGVRWQRLRHEVRGLVRVWFGIGACGSAGAAQSASELRRHLGERSLRVGEHQWDLPDHEHGRDHERAVRARLADGEDCDGLGRRRLLRQRIANAQAHGGQVRDPREHRRRDALHAPAVPAGNRRSGRARSDRREWGGRSCHAAGHDDRSPPRPPPAVSQRTFERCPTPRCRTPFSNRPSLPIPEGWLSVRDESGMGLIELLIAMKVVLNVGLLRGRQRLQQRHHRDGTRGDHLFGDGGRRQADGDLPEPQELRDLARCDRPAVAPWVNATTTFRSRAPGSAYEARHEKSTPNV